MCISVPLVVIIFFNMHTGTDVTDRPKENHETSVFFVDDFNSQSTDRQSTIAMQVAKNEGDIDMRQFTQRQLTTLTSP